MCIHFRALILEFDPGRISGGEALLYGFYIPAAPDDLDDQIDHIDRRDESLLDLFFLLLSHKQRPVFARAEIKTEVDMMADRRDKSEGFRLSVRDREHIDTEGILKLCLLIQEVL